MISNKTSSFIFNFLASALRIARTSSSVGSLTSTFSKSFKIPGIGLSL
ncbi:MAG: hypothetical protein ABIG90_03190 [bacterium]